MLRTDVGYVDAQGRLTQAGFQAFQSEMTSLAARLSAAEAKIAAAAAVANAAGGVTVDAEARAQLVAIRSALT